MLKVVDLGRPGAVELKDSITLKTALDGKEEVAWLELSMSRAQWDGTAGGNDVMVMVGARKDGNKKWQPIQAPVPGAKVMQLADGIPTLDAGVRAFQSAVLASWMHFDPLHSEQWAKGTSIGVSLNSPGFAAKALKTGFDAIAAPESAGFRLRDWTLKDTEKYAASRKQHTTWETLTITSLGHVGADFMLLAPDAAFDKHQVQARNDPGKHLPAADIEHIPSIRAKGPPYRSPYEDVLQHIKLPRVVGYGFRGDTRSPYDLRTNFCGSFLPNYTRMKHIDEVLHDMAAVAMRMKSTTLDTTVIDAARKLDPKEAAKHLVVHAKANPKFMEALRKEVANEKTSTRAVHFENSPMPRAKTFAEIDTLALNVVDYMTDEIMGGFISVTRSIAVAKSFASGRANIGGTPYDGWVYACFVEGALRLPLMGEKIEGGGVANKQEFELAMPGMLDWQDVVGWRRVTAAGYFSGPVFLRKSLHQSDPDAWKLLYQYLSGKNQ